MMTLTPKSDRYQITWRCHIDCAQEARRWCHDTWSAAWGEVKFGVPNQVGWADHLFFFRREQHANWFILKYGTV